MVDLPDSHWSGFPISWSPDDSQIAFGVYLDEVWNIAIVDVPNGAVRTILDDSTTYNYFPVWSPNGEKLAYESDDGNSRLMVYDFDAGKSALVAIQAELGKFGIGEITWSPDGQKIAYREMIEEPFFEIFLVDVKGGTPVQMTESEEYFNAATTWMEWSPDGSGILFPAFWGRSDNLEIFILDISTQEVHHLTFNEFYDDAPVWISDTIIAYISRDEIDDPKTIYMLDIEQDAEAIPILTINDLIYDIGWIAKDND